jgi:hypothetical protein
VKKSYIFWDITPYGPLKVNRYFWETRSKSKKPAWGCVCYRLVSYSTLKTEATCSSETSVDFKQTAQRYIPEDRSIDSIFHNPQYILKAVPVLNYLSTTAWRRMGYWIYVFFTCRFTPGESVPVPIGQETGWALESVWMTWRRDHSWPCRNSIMFYE